MSADYDFHDKSGTPFTNVVRPKDRRKEVDLKELQDQEMASQAGSRFTAGLFPPGLMSGLNGAPTRYGVVDRFFYFDTNAKNSDSDMTVGKIVYSLSTLNQNQTVDNIIEMEIGEFFIPVVAATADFPEYFFFKRVQIFISEMIAAAIMAQNNQRFHFELGVQAAGIANILYDVGFNKFIFTRPFKTIDRMTFNFLAPSRSFKNVTFSQDIFDFRAIPIVAGGVFGGATIATTVPHGLTVGTDVSIFISNFASNVSNIDALINSPNGFLVRVINATVLEFRAIGVVGFNFTNVLVPVPGTLLVGFRRIAFSMRIRSLTDGETNTIVPV